MPDIINETKASATQDNVILYARILQIQISTKICLSMNVWVSLVFKSMLILHLRTWA